MKREFKLQDPGEGIHEVDVLEVLVAEGDEISEGQDVLVVESDKAAVELPSPFDGKVAEIRVSVDDTATVGDVLLVVEDGEDGGEDDRREGSEANDKPASEEVEETGEDSETRRPESRDATAANRDSSPEPESGSESEPRDKDAEDEKDRLAVKASPAARKEAADLGIDIADVRPTGSDGQVTRDDVRATADDQGSDDDGPDDRDRDRDEFGPVERRAIHSVRAATARAMSRSWREIPHAVHEDIADITELERWRRRARSEGSGVSLTAIAIKAVATILEDEPRFNATYDADNREIVERRYYNVNVAVATDHGLVTPVVTEANEKTIAQIDEELAGLAEKARDRRLKKPDVSGGTFTVTNIGALGGRGLFPIINPPQTAILGLARAALQPVVTSDPDDARSPEIAARMILPMALSFDHRVLDGADAARFAKNFAALLSDPLTLALDT